MSYRVFQNNKRCNDYHIGDWKNDTFESKDEAETFAFLWAFPVSHEEAEQMKFEMQLNVNYYFGDGVYMMITETIDGTDENWENRTLGSDERFVGISDLNLEQFL